MIDNLVVNQFLLELVVAIDNQVVEAVIDSLVVVEAVIDNLVVVVVIDNLVVVVIDSRQVRLALDSWVAYMFLSLLFFHQLVYNMELIRMILMDSNSLS